VNALHQKQILVLMVAILMVLAVGCANKATIKGDTVRTDYTRYTIKTPKAPAWKRIDVKDCDVGYFHKRYAAVISINSTCEEYQDATPETLTRHLLFGLQDRKVHSQETISIAGREGVITDVSGSLDGVPSRMKMLVVNRSYCTYDITLVAPPETFAKAAKTFDALVASFNVISSK